MAAAPPVNLVLEPEEGPAADAERRHAERRAKKQGAYAAIVREVRVEGWWAQGLALPIKAGDTLTAEKLSESLTVLREAIGRNQQLSHGLGGRGELSVLYIGTRFEPDAAAAAGAPGGSCAVIFQPYYVHLSLTQVGDNVLPIPRSAFPAFDERVPKPLRALNPTVGAFHDDVSGTVFTAGVMTDLLRFPAPVNAAPGGARLALQASGERALEKTTQRTSAALRYSQRRLAGELQQFAIGGNVDDARKPLGGGVEQRRSAEFSGGLVFKLAANTRLAWDAGYRNARSRVDSGAPVIGEDRVREQTNRLLFETIPRGIHGFLRAVVWEDNGRSRTTGRDTYTRLAARVGYAKEVSLGNSQTIGVEVLAGGGRAWGEVPAGAAFFGGTATEQFLYEGLSARGLAAMPEGPLLRSFGRREAAVRRVGTASVGGRRYWHANLNVALPIPAWSRALIPNVSVDELTDDDGKPLTVKQILREQIEISGPSLLSAVLQKEGLSADEALKKAQAVLGELQPATRFIIDDASLFAVKPLLMLDAAGLSEPGAGSGARVQWIAGGAGVQFTIVIARFEVGYLRTLSGPTFGNRGNFSARLVFQNLF